MDSRLTIAMHDGWHIPKCPLKLRNGTCGGYVYAAAISLDDLAKHRAENSRLDLGIKRFTCGHEHGITLLP